MLRLRRKFFYLGGAFIAVWFLLNIAYLGKLKINNGLPRVTSNHISSEKDGLSKIRTDQNDRHTTTLTSVHTEHAGNHWEIPKDGFIAKRAVNGEASSLVPKFHNGNKRNEPDSRGRLSNTENKNADNSMNLVAPVNNLEPPDVGIGKADDVHILDTLRGMVMKKAAHAQKRSSSQDDKDPDTYGVKLVSDVMQGQTKDRQGSVQKLESFNLQPLDVNENQFVDGKLVTSVDDTREKMNRNDEPNRDKTSSQGLNSKSEKSILDLKFESNHRQTSSEANIDDGLTPDERKDISDGFERHSFNVVASNTLPIDREIPDFRPDGCPSVENIHGLPSVSIIICFHNEALSTLLRTIQSVVNRTPPSLVKEIILVDDASTYDYLGSKLEQALELIEDTDIYIIRLRRRQGIVRSRMFGVEKAQGGVLVFLDSHCECAVGWLPPLLEALSYNTKKIVCPEVDVISYETFEYTAQEQLHYGTFDWNLQIVWKPVPEDQLKWRSSPIDPVRTPTMLGGIFAVNKNYFHEIGQYDEAMYIWGGENIELSFRVWMCGGSIEILPCSRVGHVFRPVIPYGFPMGNPQSVIAYNNQRVAEVWMDEYKAYFYALQKRKQTAEVMEAVRGRKVLRSQLQCQSFMWYMINVAIDVPVPPIDAEYFGQIKQKSSGKCVQKVSSNLYLVECVPQHPAQVFHISASGHLKRGEMCVDVHGSKQQLNFTQCTEKTMVCRFNEQHNLLCESKLLPDRKTAMCFDSITKNMPLVLYRCASFDQPRQIWSITHHFDTKKLALHYY